MREKCVQISFFNTYSDINDSMESNKSELVRLLEEYVDIEALIPFDFYRTYDRRTGRKRINPLESFIRAFIIQRLLGMKENKQLLTLLTFSPELRDYCGFIKLPDEPQLSRFKKDFCVYIKRMFDSLVDITEPICREIDPKKADYLIFDTTGIEPYVKENNPKFFNAKLNSRNTGSAHGDFNKFGNPVCPKTGEQFICLGSSGGKNRSERLKWVCPKSEPAGTTRHCTLAERTINLFKEAFGLNYLKTQSAVSAKFDLYLAACTQLIGVILAEAINRSSLFRSVRKIVKLVSCA